MDFSSFLQEIGAAAHLDTSAAAQSGGCTSVFSATMEVTFEHDAKTQIVQVFAPAIPIGQWSLDLRTRILSKVLQLHLFGMTTDGNYFGFDAQLDRIVFFRSVPLSGLEPAQAVQAIESFVNQLERWQAHLVRASAAQTDAQDLTPASIPCSASSAREQQMQIGGTLGTGIKALAFAALKRFDTLNSLVNRITGGSINRDTLARKVLRDAVNLGLGMTLAKKGLGDRYAILVRLASKSLFDNNSNEMHAAIKDIKQASQDETLPALRLPDARTSDSQWTNALASQQCLAQFALPPTVLTTAQRSAQLEQAVENGQFDGARKNALLDLTDKLSPEQIAPFGLFSATHQGARNVVSGHLARRASESQAQLPAPPTMSQAMAGVGDATPLKESSKATTQYPCQSRPKGANVELGPSPHPPRRCIAAFAMNSSSMSTVPWRGLSRQTPKAACQGETQAIGPADNFLFGRPCGRSS